MPVTDGMRSCTDVLHDMLHRPERETVSRGQWGKQCIHVELVELSAQVGGVGGQDVLYVCQDACLLKVEVQVKIAGIQPESFSKGGV